MLRSNQGAKTYDISCTKRLDLLLVSLKSGYSVETGLFLALFTGFFSLTTAL